MAKKIEDYQKDWQAAQARGDKAGMDAAHAAAEALRAQSGYSGGADGTQHIALPTTPAGGSYTPKGTGSASPVYTPRGEGSDHWAGVNQVTGTDNDLLHKFQDQYNEAKARGDSAAMDAAHAAAEALRAQYGYSGGTDGSEGWAVPGMQKPSGSTGGQAPIYTEKYQPQIDDLMQKILQRDPFSYNYLEDPLYQQYRDAYTREGARAMQDTMGQAAARTGGYLSTAGQVAAQQANNYYTAKIGDKVPELQQLAYQMWMNDYDMDVKDLGLLQGLEDFNYEKFLTELGQFNTDRNFNYGAYRDLISDERYNSEVQYARALERAKMLAAAGDFSGYSALGYSDSDIAMMQAAAQMQQSAGGGRVSGGGGTGNDYYTALYDAGIKSEGQAYQWLVNSGMSSSNAKTYAKYYVDMLSNGEFETQEPEDDMTGTARYGPNYSGIYRNARRMYDQGKTQKEIIEYLDLWGENQITEDGVAYILRNLGIQ